MSRKPEVCPQCGQLHLHVYDGERREEFIALPGWKEMHEGAIVEEAGNAVKYHTGDWRTERPIWLPDVCIHCMLCWMFCTDAAWRVKEHRITGVDYSLCKG